MEIRDVRDSVPTNAGYFSEKFGSLWEAQIEELGKRFPGKVRKALLPKRDLVDILTLEVAVDILIDLLRTLKEDSSFQYGFLSDLTATDESPETPRFFVVYHLFSHETKARIRVKVRVEEGQPVPTLTQVWTGANWAEREVFDMFGIKFEGHPDLRRILMDPRWEGHPLRKDYPIKGYQIFPTTIPVQEDLLK
jgi:NADH-quinone oxidoreductase subunit C